MLHHLGAEDAVQRGVFQAVEMHKQIGHFRPQALAFITGGSIRSTRLTWLLHNPSLRG